MNLSRTLNKVTLFAAATLFFSITATAQDISFADHKVTIDGKECFKISGDPNNVVFSTMEDEAVIILKFANPTSNLYSKIMFVKEKKSLTSRSYIFNKKNLIKNLVKAGALQDCKLNENKLEVFIMKYDEHIEQ